MDDIETVPLKALSRQQREELLRGLGYDTDGTFVLKDGAPHIDPCTGSKIRIDNMMVLPGSAIVLDANEASLSWYVANYSD